MTALIRTYSGELIDLIDPDTRLIRLEDIAQGLGNLCRFTGQCSAFYSVAEHACLVSERLRRWNADVPTQLMGLHHDDAEAYLGDVTTPLKDHLEEYSEYESEMMGEIEIALDLPVQVDWIAIHRADKWAVSVESSRLLTHTIRPHLIRETEAPWWDELRWGLSPALARRKWLRLHARLSAA